MKTQVNEIIHRRLVGPGFVFVLLVVNSLRRTLEV